VATARVGRAVCTRSKWQKSNTSDMVKISKNEVIRYSPIIADMLALNTSNFTIEEIAQKIIDRLEKRPEAFHCKNTV
jgi:hypothetical protein